MKINIGLSDKDVAKSNNSLIDTLASEMMLYVKTRKFHWNVAGESFMEFHKLFENQYKELEVIIDEVAERIGKLGDQTPGTMTEFIKKSFLKEEAGKYGTTKEMLKELLNDHEAIITFLRKSIAASINESDVGTIDFYTKLIEQHETNAWILRRYNKQ
jgi:starvation-inducible DNA-binding protein